jgi:hypothetical protein
MFIYFGRQPPCKKGSQACHFRPFVIEKGNKMAKGGK